MKAKYLTLPLFLMFAIFLQPEFLLAQNSEKETEPTEEIKKDEIETKEESAEKTIEPTEEINIEATIKADAQEKELEVTDEKELEKKVAPPLIPWSTSSNLGLSRMIDPIYPNYTLSFSQSLTYKTENNSSYTFSLSIDQRPESEEKPTFQSISLSHSNKISIGGYPLALSISSAFMPIETWMDDGWMVQNNINISQNILKTDYISSSLGFSGFFLATEYDQPQSGTAYTHFGMKQYLSINMPIKNLKFSAYFGIAQSYKKGLIYLTNANSQSIQLSLNDKTSISINHSLMNLLKDNNAHTTLPSIALLDSESSLISIYLSHSY